MDAPKQLTETLHEYGKADGAGEKAENKTSSLNESSPITHSSLTEVVEDMQWEKAQNQGLGKAPTKVNPISTPPFTNFPSMTELSRSEEDIPPGFEGQHRMEVLVQKILIN